MKTGGRYFDDQSDETEVGEVTESRQLIRAHGDTLHNTSRVPLCIMIANPSIRNDDFATSRTSQLCGHIA